MHLAVALSLTYLLIPWFLIHSKHILHCHMCRECVSVNMAFHNHDLLMKDVQSVVTAQMQEMELVRQKVYALEQNQLNMKERYVIPNMLGD